MQKQIVCGKEISIENIQRMYEALQYIAGSCPVGSGGDVIGLAMKRKAIEVLMEIDRDNERNG